MSSIQTGIELNDQFSSVLYSIIGSVNLAVSAICDMQQSLDADIDTSSLEGARDEINQATAAIVAMNEALDNQTVSDILPDTEPVTIPVQWETDGLEVFTNSGIERFEQEVQSANQMLNTLNETQSRIQAAASTTDILPDNAITDITNMGQRLLAIQECIQQISSNPVNMGTDEANAEMERLRAQLEQAVQEQNELSAAVDNLDFSAANDAYLRLSQTVSGTERYIRDNVDEQGRFNSEIQEGTNCASGLNNIISKAVGTFAGLFGVRKIFSFVSDSMDLYDTQLNAETQLMSVLANMLEDDYVADYMIETQVTADTSDAIDEINAISSSAGDVVITVDARTDALQAEFDAITAKASEIQSNGIYGDEAMIAGAAELSTYFTDPEAITTMMDTLANYAMGMSGGGELDSTAMVDYATGLGKVMSGSYEAMTKKGFEFTDAQKAIIEGTATQEQVAAALGDEYIDMSSDMQAAAAITQVIDESWAGLYETMSNTPQGKIIQMKNTFGDMKEVIGGQLYPYVALFVDTITENWGTIQAVLDGFVAGLQNIMVVLNWLLEGAMSFASFVTDNWSVISPIVVGIAVAMGLYTTALAANAVVQGIHNMQSAIAAVQEYAHAKAVLANASAHSAETVATASATVAQASFNTVLAACPITWIIIAIIALIAVIFALCNWIAETTEVTESGFGIICGVISTAAAFILNQFIGLINILITLGVNLYNHFANFAAAFGILFDDPVAAIKAVILSMFNFIVGVVTSAAQLLDAIFGSNLADAVSGFQAKVQAEIDATIENAGGDAAKTLNPSDYTLDRINYDDAFDAGASWGDGVADAVSNFSLSDVFGGADIPNVSDYTSGFNDAIASSGVGDNLGDIAGDTGAIKDSMDITAEDLKYLRDIAEQEAINRFTLAEITIDQSGMQNTINSGDDIDGFMTKLTDSVNEAVDNMTEGVHK